MALRSGIGGQLGMKAETTYGTYIAPDRFLEFISEGLKYNRDKIKSNAIRRGSTVQRTGRWATNKKGGGGPVNYEVATKGFGLPLKHAMGTSVITTPVGATLARRHRYTLGDLDDLSLTIQKGVPDVGGVTRAFSFLGCVCTEWELSVEVDGLVLFNPMYDARDMVTDQALATASFPAGDELFGYQQCAITIGGGPEAPTSVTLNCGHQMATDRYKVRAQTTKDRPVLAGERDLGGSLTFEFESMVQANRFLQAAPGAELPVTFTATGDEIDVGVNAYALAAQFSAVVFDGDIPVIEGPEVVTITAPFEAADNGTEPPLILDYTTTDTAD